MSTKVNERVRPHSCPYDDCNSKYILKRDLTRHMRSHELWSLIECDKCEFTSERRDSVNAHIKRKHGESSKGKVTKFYKNQASEITVDISTPIAVGEVSGEGSKGKVRKVHKKRASKIPVDTSTPIAVGEVSEDTLESRDSVEQSLAAIIKHLEKENSKLKNKVRSKDKIIKTIKIIKTESVLTKS
jgi:hypothetical protein